MPHKLGVNGDLRMLAKQSQTHRSEEKVRKGMHVRVKVLDIMHPLRNPNNLHRDLRQSQINAYKLYVDFCKEDNAVPVSVDEFFTGASFHPDA